MDDLSNYTLVELRQLAKEKGLKNVTKLKKDELIEELTKIKSEETVAANNTRFQIDEGARDDSDLAYKLTNSDDFIAEGVL